MNILMFFSHIVSIFYTFADNSEGHNSFNANRINQDD